MKFFLIALHLVFYKLTSDDKIILSQNNQQYFDILTYYNPRIQEIKDGNQSNQQMITYLRSEDGQHNLTYYHIIEGRITICIDYSNQNQNQNQKKVNISINLDEYYSQEFLLQIKVDKELCNIDIILKQENGLSLIKEQFEMDQISQFDEWQIAEQLENFQPYSGLIKYRQDYVNYYEEIDFNNPNITVIQNNNIFRINDIVYNIDSNLLSLKQLSNENITLMIDGQNMITKNQIIEWSIVNFESVRSQTFRILPLKLFYYLTANYIELSNTTFKYYNYYSNNSVINILENPSNEDLIVNLTNLLFLKCQFESTQFINYSSFSRNLLIQLENVVFRNCSFEEFTFFRVSWNIFINSPLRLYQLMFSFFIVTL
ncbi:hypothetical protein pb186bvf_010112 [Paramecium bursaria]